MIFWSVYTRVGTDTVIVNAASREIAKSKAFAFLGGNPDTYIVSPITHANARVFLDITVRGAA